MCVKDTWGSQSVLRAELYLILFTFTYFPSLHAESVSSKGLTMRAGGARPSLFSA